MIWLFFSACAIGILWWLANENYDYGQHEEEDEGWWESEE